MLPFALLLGDASVVPASAMKIVAAPKTVELTAEPGASRLAERIPGKAVVTELEDESGRLHVTWRVILRDGSNYRAAGSDGDGEVGGCSRARSADGGLSERRTLTSRER